MPYQLSKSSFVKGLQCEKALYLTKKHPELIPPVDAAQQAIFDQGTSVGELAQQLFPGGVNCDFETYDQIGQSIADTKRSIDRGDTVIYEAAFKEDNTLVFVDILVKHEEGWKMYEVKSSTHVKRVNIQDAALQTHVLSQAGIELVDVAIVHINNQYVKKGFLDIWQLFTFSSVWDDIQYLLPEIPDQINMLLELMQKEEVPNMDIGPHCSNPYPCALTEHCWSHIPEKSVFDVRGLNGRKKFELYNKEILRMVDIPEYYPLTAKQKRQVNGLKHGTTVVDEPAIKNFVEQLKYPLYYLDFETFAAAVPLFDESRPYQHLPFQYSLHVQHEVGGTCTYFEYLAESDGSDPRMNFIKKLIVDCGTIGDVIVYNKGFESGKLKDLARDFPEYSEPLLNIRSRLVDLMVPFQKGWYYTPEMNGSYSIKAVLPALVPDESYYELAIGDGGTASLIFQAMAEGVFNGDINQTRKDLLAYCKLDTWGMVRIVEKLNSLGYG